MSPSPRTRALGHDDDPVIYPDAPVTPAPATYAPDLVRQYTHLETLSVNTSRSGATPRKRTTRVDGLIAALIRHSAAGPVSGPVFVVEEFRRNADWLDVVIQVRIETSVVKTFFTTLNDEPSMVIPHELVNNGLMADLDDPQTPYVDLFEWFSDTLIAAGYSDVTYV